MSVNANRRPVVAGLLVVIILGLVIGLIVALQRPTPSLSSAGTNDLALPAKHAVSGGFGSAGESGSGLAAIPAPVEGEASFSASGRATQPRRIVPSESPDIIHTGSMLLSVRRGNLLKAFDAVTSDAAGQGGYIADSSSASQNTQAPTASLVIRVPSSRFTSLILAVSALGKVENEQVQGQDVTGQLVNLSARITNLEAEQVALRALVERAGSIPNILQAQNELFTVESEIEQLSAEQASLDSQTSYATLTVNLETHARPLPPKPRRENVLTRAPSSRGTTWPLPSERSSSASVGHSPCSSPLQWRTFCGG